MAEMCSWEYIHIVKAQETRYACLYGPFVTGLVSSHNRSLPTSLCIETPRLIIQQNMAHQNRI